MDGLKLQIPLYDKNEILELMDSLISGNISMARNKRNTNSKI